MCRRLICLLSVLWISTLLSTRAALAELAGWWKLDETSGDIAYDSIRSANDGTLLNGPLWTTGQIDGALQLDGIDDYVELPIGSLVATLSDATLMLWANWSGEGGAWQRILDFGTGTANYIYLCPEDGSGLMHVAITANTGTWTDITVSSGALPTGWHHIAIVVDKTTENLKVLLDAEVVADASTLYLLANLGNTTQNWLGRSQYSADPYFKGVIDDFRIYNETLSPAQIARIMLSDTTTSKEPNPADKATDVSRDVVLSWTSGEFAETHDVYLGTSSADVGAADRGNPLGVLVSQGQDANSFDPGRLELGQTYYWRVDEVNAAPDTTVFKGAVWSFTVEPFSYPIPGVVATASGSSKANMGPEKTVDGSGLNELDQHDTDSTHSWLSSKGDSAWIQFTFDGVYKLDKTLVWNCNQALESILGVSAKDVKVEYSADGEAWTALGDFVFAQSSGTEDYVANTALEFAGVAAKAVKFTITSNWGDVLNQYGLSEVRFYAVPVTAREPSPADNANDVNPQVLLSWRAGREADSHKVYLGADEQAVAEGTAPVVTVNAPEYEASLVLDSTYYWKVTEVNDAEAISAWDGNVWTFDTAHFVAVDDFESYTDDQDTGGAIFQAWIDGYEDAANGSLVGYIDPPFAEQTVVLSGKQSMPLAYDNTGGVAYSEATLSFDPAQGWTQHGFTTLVLSFRGQSTNDAAPLYLKINDKKVSFNNGAATTIPVWKQWILPLAGTGAGLKSVKSLTIGVEGSGTGMLFVDDIRLYAVAPEAVVPVDPGTAGLAALYTMDGNVQDTAGKKYDGTLNGDASYEPGYAGQALVLNGVNAYVDLPIGPMIATMTNATIATHVYFGGGSGGWQRVFDFGTDTTVYMFLSPRQGTGGAMRFAIRTATVAEQVVDGPMVPVGWHHMAIAIDATAMRLNLYLDGVLVRSAATTLLPKDLDNTTQNWIGRSQWTADAYLLGSVDDFRIYNRVLSEAEVRYLAGDR